MLAKREKERLNAPSEIVKDIRLSLNYDATSLDSKPGGIDVSDTKDESTPGDYNYFEDEGGKSSISFFEDLWFMEMLIIVFFFQLRFIQSKLSWA